LNDLKYRTTYIIAFHKDQDTKLKGHRCTSIPPSKEIENDFASTKIKGENQSQI